MVQTPSPPTLTRKTRVKEELIPLDERAFCYYKNGSLRGTGGLGRGSASKKAESRAVVSMVNVINKETLSDTQKVQALRKASTHHLSRRIFQSAGMIDDNKYQAMKHVLNQMRKIVADASKATQKRGEQVIRRDPW